MDYLIQFVAIICFVGGAPPPQILVPQWLSHFQRDMCCPFFFACVLGKGFYTIKTTDLKAVWNLMIFLFYRYLFGLCVFQCWIPDFDPMVERRIMAGDTKAKTRLKIPTWVTLRNL
jgi:hypothetical protein